MADDLGDERFVLIGRPDDTLTAGLHSVGLAPVAEDGEVVVWAPPPSPQPPGPSATDVLISIADAALALGASRGTIYELIGRGELAATPVGGSLASLGSALTIFGGAGPPRPWPTTASAMTGPRPTPPLFPDPRSARPRHSLAVRPITADLSDRPAPSASGRLRASRP